MRSLQGATQILEAFQNNGIRVMFLKGLSLIELLYKNPALRPCSDIDLLILKEDLPKAIDVLENLGYTLPGNMYPIEFYTKYHSVIPWPITLELLQGFQRGRPWLCLLAGQRHANHGGGAGATRGQGLSVLPVVSDPAQGPVREMRAAAELLLGSLSHLRDGAAGRGPRCATRRGPGP